MQLPYIEVEATFMLLQESARFLWKQWPMNMQATGLDNNTAFSLRGECPHCRHESVFMQVTSTFTQGLQLTKNGQARRLVAAMRCQGCLAYILAQVIHIIGDLQYHYEAHFPLGKPDDEVAPEIPDHIKPDLKEALRCLWVNAYNATAEMCRRAIEASCIGLGATPKDVLEDMIDDLESKRIITPFLRDVAHKIRLGGNRGAHPGDPTAPSAITENHAKAIVKFTTEFFHHVYVVPKELDKYDFSKPKAAKP